MNTLSHVTELDLFSYLGRLVRAWPATYSGANTPELRHKRINTFAVIDDEMQLDSTTLNKDSRHKGKPFFFCRWWEDNGFRDDELKKEFPAMLVWEESGAMPSVNTTDELVKLWFVIQDRFVEKFEPGTDGLGGQRTQEEIKQDIKTLRDTVLAAMRSAVWIQLPGATSPSFYPEEWLVGQGIRPVGPRMTNYMGDVSVETSTVAREVDGSFVEAYFQLSFKRASCPTEPALEDFNFDTDLPAEMLDHPGGASA